MILNTGFFYDLVVIASVKFTNKQPCKIRLVRRSLLTGIFSCELGGWANGTGPSSCKPLYFGPGPSDFEGKLSRNGRISENLLGLASLALATTNCNHLFSVVLSPPSPTVKPSQVGTLLKNYFYHVEKYKSLKALKFCFVK